MQEVILVSDQDEVLGTCEKLEAHQKGLLHRAFSIFILNSNGEMLIHKRALSKYHSGGLWTNACCSHPILNVAIEDTLQERLQFEMGMSCPLEFAFQFLYKGELDHGLIEHELDHVYLGYSDTLPQPNPEEVSEYRYMNLQALQLLVDENPEQFTIWFKIALPKIVEHLENKKTWA
jgi:isopentenyl-diphosphate delta-isomerase